MPKKETKEAAPKKSAEELKKEKADKAAAMKKAKEEKAAKQIFNFKGMPAEGDKKLCKQEQGIMDLIKTAGKKGITRPDLLTAMEEVITTVQPIGRILSYYQKGLVERGYVEVTQ